MNRRKISIFAAGIICFLIFSSCASTGAKENTNFTALFIDEKSLPVSNLEVSVKAASGKKYNLFTSEDGFVFVPETKKGMFEIAARKSGYSELKEKVSVRDFGKVSCFRVSSADCVFDEVESLVLLERYKEALKKIDSIYTGKNRELNSCVSFYKSKIHKEEKK